MLFHQVLNIVYQLFSRLSLPRCFQGFTTLQSESQYFCLCFSIYFSRQSITVSEFYKLKQPLCTFKHFITPTKEGPVYTCFNFLCVEINIMLLSMICYFWNFFQFIFLFFLMFLLLWPLTFISFQIFITVSFQYILNSYSFFSIHLSLS